MTNYRSELKHAPLLPLEYRSGVIRNRVGVVVAFMEKRAPASRPLETDDLAAFIVRACNAHEGSVAAMENMVAYLCGVIDANPLDGGAVEVRNELQAALAKAKEDA